MQWINIEIFLGFKENAIGKSGERITMSISGKEIEVSMVVGQILQSSCL